MGIKDAIIKSARLLEGVLAGKPAGRQSEEMSVKEMEKAYDRALKGCPIEEKLAVGLIGANVLKGCSWALVREDSEFAQYLTQYAEDFEMSETCSLQRITYNEEAELYGYLVYMKRNRLCELLGPDNRGPLTAADLLTVKKNRDEAGMAMLDKLESGFSGKIGIYCTNDTQTITIRGKVYPAYAVTLRELCWLCENHNYGIVIEGKPRHPKQIMQREDAVLKMLPVAPSGQALFIYIAPMDTADGKNGTVCGKGRQREESYGEVLGWERYCSSWVIIPEWEQGLLRHTDSPDKNFYARRSYYDGHFYYTRKRDGMLFCSDEQGGNIRVVADRGADRIYVNSFGIYLISGDAIVLLDFDGTEKEVIEGKVDDCYICDDRIFTLVNSEVRSTVTCYDTTNHTHHIICSLKTEKGEGEASKGGRIKCILANRKRVVLHAKFWNDLYEENDYDYVLRLGSAWYSYDFTTRCMTCLDQENIWDPHGILDSPERFYRELGDFVDFGGSVDEVRKPKIRIERFDMEKDVMWIKKEQENDAWCVWESSSIDGLGRQERGILQPSWKVPKEYGGDGYGPHFFDGKNRYLCKDRSTLYSYTPAGERSDNWYTSTLQCAQCADSFSVFGKYLFFVDVGWTESQYMWSGSLNRPTPLRDSWMGDDALAGYDAVHEEAEEQYRSGRITVGKETEKALPEEAAIDMMTAGISFVASGKIPSGKLGREEYWKAFVTYAFTDSGDRAFQAADFPIAPTADRNWYALRVGTAKLHIELSFNTQKNSLRTALLIKDRSLLEALERQLEAKKPTDAVLINRESQTANISFSLTDVDLAGGSDRERQFQWFMEKACFFKELAAEVL